METNIRHGQLSEADGPWDNGFYTKGETFGLDVEFLVDNGSTVTLLSKSAFDNIPKTNQGIVDPATLKVRHANGNLIKTYGSLIVPINFNGKVYNQRSINCDIGQDGILGQDFLLRYVSRINYKQYVLHTDQGDIQCQVYGKSDITCRIQFRRTTLVPPLSGIWVPVDIPGSENLTKYGYALPTYRSSNMSMIPGVLDLDEKVVSIVNPSGAHNFACKGTNRHMWVLYGQTGRVSLIQETVPLDTTKPA